MSSTLRTFWVPVDRDVVRVEGPDAAGYLHSQVSQDLRPLPVGQSTWAFLLQPTGRVDVLLRVSRTGEEAFVLDTDAGFGEVMTARLQRFKIRVKAEISPLPWTSIAVRGEGLDVPGGAVVGWGSGYDLLGESPVPPTGVPEGDADDLLAARIEAAWPAMGAEIVPGTTMVAELGIADRAVSFTKGCYPGQELVERMDSRGATAPRSLQAVDVPAGTGVGAEVHDAGGVVIGTVTSVAGTRALASVRRGAHVD